MSNPPNYSRSLHAEEAGFFPTSEQQGIEFNLNEHRWRHRIVLLFASSKQSPAYQQQLEFWQSDTDGIRERDLQLVEVMESGESRANGKRISLASVEQLKQRFGATSKDFVVVLIVKDGTEKHRSQTPIDLTLLFRTIDAMPMRQQEMRSQQASN